MRMRFLAVIFGLLIPMAGFAANLAVFDNDTYTDVDHESANLIASLQAAGHSVTTFSGITAADWGTALAGADALVIPELDNGALEPDLDQAALDVISAFVAGGGGFIGISTNRYDDVGGTDYFRDTELWNAIFGYSLEHSAVSEPYTLQVVGGPFAGMPPSLVYLSAVEGLVTGTLPPGAESVYTDTGGVTVVSWWLHGAGTFVQLGYDWFEATDGADPDDQADWDAVLARAVEVATGSRMLTPVPATGLLGLMALIVLLGTTGLIFTRRHA
ncbi:MAG: hypothetical protein PVF46_04315 [Lysobacterales bacterium]